MNIFRRLGALCTDFNFIANTVIPEKSLKPSFKFWFFWNTVLTFILGLGIFFAVGFALGKIETEVLSALPDFEALVESGQLSTNLTEPVTFQNEKTVFVLDTKNIAYTKEVLESFETGFFVEKTGFYFQPEKGADVMFYSFSNLKNQVISKQGLIEDFQTKNTLWALIIAILGMLGIWFLLNILVLPIVFVFALIFWGIAQLFALRDFGLSTSFAALLNYYLLFNFLQILLVLGGLAPSWGLLLVFGLLGMNLYQVRKQEYEL